MRRRLTTAWLALLLLLLGAALVFLAVLQYRWIGEVSSADDQRSRSTLVFASRQFSDELERNIGRVINTFQGMADEDQLPARESEWSNGAQYPALIREIYLADDDKLQRFDRDAQRLVDVAWPAELTPIRTHLALPRFQRRAPMVDTIPAIVLPVPRRPPDNGRQPGPPPQGPPPPRPEDEYGDPGPPRADRPTDAGGEPRARDDSSRNDASRNDASRNAAGNAPRNDSPDAAPRPRRGPHPAFFIAVLDRSVIAHDLLPELTKRFFASEEEVAVTDPQGAVVWGSTPHWNGERPDVTVELMSIGPRPLNADGAHWHLLLRRGGAFAASIEAARRRNLAVSFAVLLVLGITVAMLVLLLRRAESLRLQQLEFVAGVTHELNTPLAALTSAGENLSDGIVTSPDQVSRYGAMIVKEARRLTNMVAQVLDFAGLASARAPRRREPVVVAELVREACRFVEGVQLDLDVAADLPVVEGDPDALARSVQNLVANAIKYGDGKWVGIRAAAEKRGIAISVDDRGRGIDPRDLPHLFEPFFRGRATADRVRGSGLGLTLVRQIAVNHGGTVTVERRRGGGSSFTMHLPVEHAEASNSARRG
jgi:signal transduction histidine kinase